MVPVLGVERGVGAVDGHAGEAAGRTAGVDVRLVKGGGAATTALNVNFMRVRLDELSVLRAE